MEKIREYIKSGIIELYVLGLASQEEVLEVEEMAGLHAEVRLAVDEFSDSVEKTAYANAIEPDVTIKAFVMATINYTERLTRGEVPTYPPLLSKASKIIDYTDWLSRSDMVLPSNEKGVYARIIGYTPEVTTAIVWLKDYAPTEVHHDEYERFLIVEGSCNISIANTGHDLFPGDFIEIPLHQNHKVTITSKTPCKIILQRVAA